MSVKSRIHSFEADVLDTLSQAASAIADAGDLEQALQQVGEFARELEARSRQLTTLNQAAIAIAGKLAPGKVLQQIVDSARELVGAQYAALGVPDAEGVLETFVYSGLSAEGGSEIAHPPKGLGLLGDTFREETPIRIPQIIDYPNSAGFPPGHPVMGSFLGVPIIAAEQILGTLYLTNKIGADEFTAADQELLEMLATHAAVAIKNARLYEQVGRLAIIEERARIGMDLHDGVIQSIYAVGLTLESARLAMLDNLEEADHLLGRAIEGLNDTIRDIRNFILDLRPYRFEGDLKVGLARLVREFQANTMVMVSMTAPTEVVAALPTPVARTIFLTMQESLANIARHARAFKVIVRVERVDSSVVLTVVDDGRGFDVATLTRSVGHGLSNMRDRAEELNGAFTVRSTPGQGTMIVLTLPCY